MASTLKVEVLRTFYSSESFSAGRGRDLSSGGGTVSFAGRVYAREGDVLDLEGEWVDDPKWGRQFKAEAARYHQALDPAGLRLYLAKSDAFAGIGPRRAAKIVDEIGADQFEAVLRDDPARFVALGVPEGVVGALSQEWFDRRAINETSTALSRWGISSARCRTLVSRFGSGVARKIEEDPYFLIGRVPGMGYLSVDKIARAAGVAADHPSRIREAIRYAAAKEEGDGHVYTDRDDLLEAATALLALDVDDGGALVVAALADLLGAGILVEEDGAVYDRATHAAEVLVDQVLWEVGPLPSGLPPIETSDVRARFPDLVPGQVDAVLGAINHRASVMTGGAGTGKTYTIRAVVDILDAQGIDVALCAPTGKAAKRLAESVGRPASTIHRLLEPELVTRKPKDHDEGDVREDEEGDLLFAFTRNEQNPLGQGYVVVDEVSMMDTRLARALLRAVDFSRTSVLLVGDHNQLPPVGPGALLRDAIAYRPLPVTVLDVVHRNAGELKHAIHAVLDGEVRRGHTKAADDSPEIRPWYVLDGFRDAAAVRAFVVDLFRTRLARYEIRDRKTGEVRPVDPWSDVQLLTPMHRGPIGTIELNRVLQGLRQEELGVQVDPPRNPSHRSAPIKGDSIIWTRNDRKTGLMNGEVGVVLEVEKDGDGRRVFLLAMEGHEEPIAVPPDLSHLMQLAYALTVHKVQGSEYPVVVTVVDPSHRVMHHRGLLYTAVSRARTSSILVGSGAAIRRAAQVVQTNVRRTRAARRARAARAARAAGR
uniref:Putative ATPase domain containing protein n=1 Tax=viral metagenome TaxID=1070528 RepID=A0A6M3JBK9_9ZZZZ